MKNLSSAKNISLAEKRERKLRAKNNQLRQGCGEKEGIAMLRPIVGTNYYYCIIVIDVEDVVKKGAQHREQRYWIKDLSLFVSDRQSLMSGDWLTDAIINCAQKLLKESYPLMGGLQMTTLGENLAYTIQRNEFVQIINVRKNHWITVTNIGCISSHIKVYDSIPSGNISSRAIQEICAMIFSDAKEITLNFPPVQSQRGGSDCGLFAIAFATTLCTGFDPVHLLYNQHSFRSHLLDCINKRCITQFPCTMFERQRLQSIPPLMVSIYCLCRQPEGGRMARCDQCQEWYHEECVSLPKDISSIEWYCPICNS